MRIKKLRDKIVWVKVRIDRGSGLFGYIKYIYYPLGFKIALESITMLFLFGIAMLACFFFVGWFDYKYGIWLKETEYLTFKVAPLSKKKVGK